MIFSRTIRKIFDPELLMLVLLAHPFENDLYLKVSLARLTFRCNTPGSSDFNLKLEYNKLPIQVSFSMVGIHERDVSSHAEQPADHLVFVLLSFGFFSPVKLTHQREST